MKTYEDNRDKQPAKEREKRDKNKPRERETERTEIEREISHHKLTI